MGKILLARVDERLIHGQVMTQLSKKSGANAIFVVDDQVAEDDFMKNIYLNSGTRTGLQIKIFSEKKCLDYWMETSFENFKVIMIARTIETFFKLIQAGIPVIELNICAISRKPDTTSIIKSVSITKEQLEMLKKLSDDYKVISYFQAIPSTKKVNLEEAVKIMG